MFNLNTITQNTSAEIVANKLVGTTPEALVASIYNTEVSLDAELTQYLTDLKQMYSTQAKEEVSIIVAGGLFRESILQGTINDVDVFISTTLPYNKSHVYAYLARYFAIKEAKEDIIIKHDADATYTGPCTMESFKFHTKNGTEINTIVYYETADASTILSQFTADFSRIGVEIFSKGVALDTPVSYTEGVKAMLTNRITFNPEGTTLQQLVRYMKKLLNRSWASETVFVYDNFGYNQDECLGKDVNLSGQLHYNTNLAFVLASEVGLFNIEEASYEVIETIRNQLDCFRRCLTGTVANEILGNYKMFWNECSMSPSEAVKAFYEGYIYSQDYLDFYNTLPDQSDLRLFVQRTISSKIENFYNTFQRSPSLASQRTGWGILSVLSANGQELFIQGKKRMALSEDHRSTRYYNAPLITALLAEYFIANGFKENLPHHSETGYYIFPKVSVKASVLKNFKAQDLNQLTGTIEWASVLGKEALNLSSYWLNHSQVVEGQEVPVKFQKAVSQDSDALYWVFEANLDIDWTYSNSVRKNIQYSLSKKYHLDPHMTAELYKDPNLFQAIDFATANDNSQVVLNPLLPTENIEVGDYIMEVLPKKDVKNLNIGNFTSCCQTLTGAGHMVCVEGWNDPHSVNYVIKSINSGTIYSHFWMWVSQDGHLVIDSIEGRDNPELVTAVTEIVKQFGTKYDNVLLSSTGYGFTRDVARNLGLHEIVTAPTSITRYSYMDARQVYKLSKKVVDFVKQEEQLVPQFNAQQRSVLNPYAGPVPF